MRCQSLVILFFIIYHSFGLNAIDSIFHKSNELYGSGMFQDALIGYQSILNQDIGNDILYYNIANCYYKLNKLGYARLYYEKVNMCNPSDKDVAHNIQIVKNKLIDDIVPLPEFFIVGIIKRMNSMFSASQWGYIAVFFLYLILLFFILFLFSASVDFKVNSLRGVILLVPIFLIVLFFLFYSNRAKPLEAILIEDNTYVKTAPSESSSDYFIIHEGIKFQLIDELDGWSRILLSDGKDGWLQNKTFQKIQ